MNNRIISLFKEKKEPIKSIFFTAGYPNLTDTLPIIKCLDQQGIDLIEIGMPFSDPLADGPIIQESSMQALHNGMSIEVLLEQLKDLRKHTSIPIVLMGYLNPIHRYGASQFFEKISTIGVDGLIIPDMPLPYYQSNYEQFYKKNQLSYIPLITPTTSVERMQEIDKSASGFLYLVSSMGTTGKTAVLCDQSAYFDRVKKAQLKTPTLIGFGINSSATVEAANSYSGGGIIGSAFINALTETGSLEERITRFMKKIYGY